MARAYGLDLRVRVLDAVDADLSRRAATRRYRIGVATVIRWAAHARTTGETRARRQGGPPGRKHAEHEAFLFTLIDEKDEPEDRAATARSPRCRSARVPSAESRSDWGRCGGASPAGQSRGKKQRTQPSRITPTWPKRARRGLPRSPTLILNA